MAEVIQVNAKNKPERYRELYPQVEALVNGENDLIANLANIVAAIKQTFGFLWIGFYLVREDELVLGPFQGPVACTRIKKGKGVCGQAWQQEKTILVPDVELFPGHIACNAASRSEIVVPVIKNGVVVMVLDVDSDRFNDFDATDQQELEKIATLAANL